MTDQYINKLKIFNLEFRSSFYYIQRDFIVKKFKFKNRTFYSKFEKIERFNSSLLVQQHLNREITIGAPLILDEKIDYIVLEYLEDRQLIYQIRHILKLIGVDNHFSYKGVKPQTILTFISTKSLKKEESLYLIERLNQFLVEKNIHRCRVLPNITLPDWYNIITLPIEKLEI